MTDELYHYGVKGMKWGVRRYQNPNGTYTAEGRKRYISDHSRKGSETEYRRLGKKYDKVAAKANKQYDDARRDNMSKNWWKAYNNTADVHQKQLDDLNEKYAGKNSKYDLNKKSDYRKYVKEYVDSWNKTYLSEIDKMFGKASDGSYGDFLPNYMLDVEVDDMVAERFGDDYETRKV